MTRRRRAGRVAVVVVVVAGAAVVGAAATGFGAGLRGGNRPSRAAAALPPATAKVTRQTLVDTRTETGDLGYGDTTTVTCRLQGTVTGLAAVGSTLTRGQVVYRVDNTPVVLMYGGLPAYRTLAPGVKGADVKQFEQNLYALGYRGFTVDETYSASTATAVRGWQGALGLTRTGSVELGRIVYTAGPVRVDSWKAALGAAAQPGMDVLEHTGTARVATVELGVDDQRLAVLGAAVSVKVPGGGTVAGRITGTRTVIEPASGNDPATTKIKVTVSIADPKPLAGMDQAALDVVFTADRRENVLTVPVGALLALAEGGYGVQVVDGGGTRIVAVQTGMFAGGQVEVSGGGLAEGMTVGVPA